MRLLRFWRWKFWVVVGFAVAVAFWSTVFGCGCSGSDGGGFGVLSDLFGCGCYHSGGGGFGLLSAFWSAVFGYGSGGGCFGALSDLTRQ